MFEALDRWRKPYVVQLVGSESGVATTLDFLRFGSHDEAEDWISKQKVYPSSLTFYQVVDERITRRSR